MNFHWKDLYNIYKNMDLQCQPKVPKIRETQTCTV